ncbi:hypothetical protein J416_04623 [Gracilibacillus halophilus YIM-C55.5]|uniref:Uncharacterized protein n=1 Tax=Gracilibacillus halophilus YIM-C55.5 TaxID=1308866 RepID=N4WAD5_9BACI|nr:hypothetical protein [Gracilibacillus halophilus]ENH97273.1 hypothetical protein J416_04623 [Gracilibacillus halophilus YIM-C55.5]
MKIKMLVQSTYQDQLLRAGKIYEINDETANRWVVSGIAERVDDTTQKHETTN